MLRRRDRDALRAELGYGPDERVCVVTVGGSGVGGGAARPCDRGVPAGARARPRTADDRRRRAAHRPGLAARAVDGVEVRELRPRPRSAPRRLRRRRRPGRADDLHGARGGEDAVPLLPAASATSSRTATSATASSATAPDARSTSTPRRPRRSRLRSRSRSRSPQRSPTSSATVPPALPGCWPSSSDRRTPVVRQAGSGAALASDTSTVSAGAFSRRESARNGRPRLEIPAARR